MKYVRQFLMYVLLCSALFYIIANYFPGFDFSLESEYTNDFVIYLFLGIVSWLVNVVLKYLISLLMSPISLLTFGLIQLPISFVLLYVFEQFINYLDVGVIVQLGNVIQVFVLSLILGVVYFLVKKI